VRVSLWEKGCFVINLVTQFFNYKRHLQLTMYTMQLIAIQLQFRQNNLFATIMQLHYNSTHDVILTLTIVIHILNLTCSIMNIFWHNLFSQNIDLHCPLWLLMMVRDCDMWHLFKNCHMAYINCILEKKN
jgi:hypothetical protein